MSTFYVTTAIPFVNARPHLGFALELCIADAFARHARARGRAVRFTTGTDDHSLKNVLAAEHAGVSTRDYVSQLAARVLQLGAALNVTADVVVQTSQFPGHATAVYALWNACAAAGDLYRKTYRGLYCVGCERFADPDETRCPEHEAPLEIVEELNWFFRLSRYGERIRAAIESGALAIEPAGARAEALALLREPLPDLCVSRSAERARGWGLPVPSDDTQVIWVWFDALANYLSALDFGGDGDSYRRFWSGDGTRLHVIGKGIARFHTVFWPAILASAGVVWPTHLLVHGYLTVDGVKISKSGNTLDPEPWLHGFGADAVRYFLLRHVRTGRDADFRAERFVDAYHADLANGLGNLVNRVFGLLARATASAIPARGEELPEARALREAVGSLPAEVDRAVERFALDDALAAVFERVDLANELIDRTAPWALLREGQHARAESLLRALLETLRVLAVELAPFLPNAANQLAQALHAPAETSPGAWEVLPEGAPLPATLALFPRVDHPPH